MNRMYWINFGIGLITISLWGLLLLSFIVVLGFLAAYSPLIFVVVSFLTFIIVGAMLYADEHTS